MPASLESIVRVLSSSEWSEADKWVVKWQFNASLHLLSEFETALAEAIKLADDSNLDLLARAFPTQVRGYRDWAHGDLGERLRAAGLGI